MRRFVLSSLLALGTVPIATGCILDLGGNPAGQGPAPIATQTSSSDGGAPIPVTSDAGDAASLGGCGTDQPIADFQGGTACWQVGHQNVDVSARDAQEDGILYRSSPTAGTRYYVEVVTQSNGTESGGVELESTTEPADGGTAAAASPPATIAYLYDPTAQTLTWKHYHADGTVFTAVADQGGPSDQSFFAELASTNALDGLVLLSQARQMAASYGRVTIHVIGVDDLILLGIGALIGAATAYVMCENADWGAPAPSGMVCGSTQWVDPSTFTPGAYPNCVPSGNISSWEAYWHDGELKLCCDGKPRPCQTSKGVEPCHVSCP
jgi:hypothetical protein